MHRVRRERDNAKVQALLDQLVVVAKDETQNIMPVTIELVRAGATMGDIVEKLRASGASIGRLRFFEPIAQRVATAHFNS